MITNIFVAAFFAYPFVILGGDALLKFVLKVDTITKRVTSIKWLTYFADFHMILWTILLYLHFTLGLFDG